MLRKMFCFNACLRTRTFDRSGVSVPLESLNGSKPNWRTLNGALNFPISNCGGGPGAMSRKLCVWVGVCVVVVNVWRSDRWGTGVRAACTLQGRGNWEFWA